MAKYTREEVLELVKAGKSLEGGDLAYATLSLTDLSNVNFSGADLHGTELRDVNLKGANLTNAILSDADLSGANLCKTCLNGANLHQANLSKTYLHGADLSGADLSDVNLREASLTDANLSDANLKGADLLGANLSVAYFIGADLSEADLSVANLSGANLNRANLKKANLSGADLGGASLVEADLNDADVSEADLSGANLSGTNLSGADLSLTNLSRADLVEANLSEADLSGADLNFANFIDANLSIAYLGGAKLSFAYMGSADLSGADFSEADLVDANLSKADLTKAVLSGAKLGRADLSGANFSGADLSGTDLTEANLTTAQLRNTSLASADFERATLNKADISGANIYHIKTPGWKINDIKCTHVYCHPLDASEDEIKNSRREFRDGEFESIYRSMPSIELYFRDKFCFIDQIRLIDIQEKLHAEIPDASIILKKLERVGEDMLVTLGVKEESKVKEVAEAVNRLYKDKEHEEEFTNRLEQVVSKNLLKLLPSISNALSDGSSGDKSAPHVTFSGPTTIIIQTGEGQHTVVSDSNISKSAIGPGAKADFSQNYLNNQVEADRLIEELRKGLADDRKVLVDRLTETLKGKNNGKAQSIWEEIKAGIGTASDAVSILTTFGSILGFQ